MTSPPGFSSAPVTGALGLRALGLLALAMVSGRAAAQRPAPPAPPNVPSSPRAHAPVPPTMRGASGWIGVSLIQTGRGDGPGSIAMGYPVIASVEPGSPAQDAGLVAGDTVLSYNNVNAQDNVLGVQRFLRPGQRVVMRVRRDGVRDIALTVAKRPSRSRMRVSVSTDEVAMAPASPMVQLGPIPIAAPLRISREAPLAGAQLAEINAGLASVLNVREEGVLVVDVLPGSPAMSSGLVPGDVIVRADTFAVTSPVALIRAMRLASDRTVLLDLLRKGKTQHVTLRW